MSNNRIQTQSIDDILDNIRSAINKPVSKQLVSDNYGGYDLLELTDVVQDDGTILQVKKDNNISNHQEIKLSNKILSDTVTSEKLLSDEVIVESSKYISDFVDQLLHAKLFNEQESTAQLRKLAVEVVKPYMQDWLNENLPLIVREVLEKEIKDLINKIKLN
jgi:cell pole-organizing protein PopZ